MKILQKKKKKLQHNRVSFIYFFILILLNKFSIFNFTIKLIINIINKNKEINNKEENDKGSNIDNTTNKIQHSVNQNKINEDKNRESYISLFKLGEYLYYYRCKNEEDLVNIKQDQAEESSNINNSKKFMKKISKKMTEEDENSKITIFKDKDITYMWYMEAKKKKNKSFNYQISDNYEELFNDIDMQQK